MANCKLGSMDEALKYIAKPSEVKGMSKEPYFRSAKANYLSRYAKRLSAARRDKKALDSLSASIRNAESNPKVIMSLKEVYQKINGTDKGCNEYIASLKEAAYQKISKEV